MNQTIFGREPVAIAAFFSIALNLALTFGLQLNGDQISLINSLVVAGLALIVRNSVTAPSSARTEAAKEQDEAIAARLKGGK